MLEPVIQQVALTDRVRSAILDAIVAGTLRPGQRLAQEQFAERPGVSRQPVSHALRVLNEMRAGVWAEHRQILEAVVNGDGAQAAALAEQHTRRAGETTAARLATTKQPEETAR